MNYPHSHCCDCPDKDDHSQPCMDHPKNIPAGWEWDGELWALGLMSRGRFFIMGHDPGQLYRIIRQKGEKTFIRRDGPKGGEWCSADEIVWSVDPVETPRPDAGAKEMR